MRWLYDIVYLNYSFAYTTGLRLRYKKYSFGFRHKKYNKSNKLGLCLKYQMLYNVSLYDILYKNHELGFNTTLYFKHQFTYKGCFKGQAMVQL